MATPRPALPKAAPSRRAPSPLVEEHEALELAEAASLLMQSEFASVQLYVPGEDSSEEGSLQLVASRGFHPESAEYWKQVPAGAVCSCAAALRERHRFLITDVERCEQLTGSQDLVEFRRSGIRSVQSTPLISRDGELLGMVSTHWSRPFEPTERMLRLFDVLARQFAEVIEHKQNEHELRRAKEQFEELINAAPMGVYSIDADFRMSQVNPIAMPHFERVKGGVLGRDFEDVLRQLLEPPRAAEIVDIFRRTLATGESHVEAERATYRIDRGHTEYYEWRVDRITLPDRRHGLVCYFREISTHVRVREALRASEAKYRALFESIDEGFCIIEVIFDKGGAPVDYRFLETNPAFVHQTGLSDARGRTVRELVPNHEQHWFEVYGRIACTGVPARFEHQAAQLGRWYDVYACRYGDPERRQVAVLFNDITTRKRAEDLLGRHRAELEETVRRRTNEALGAQRHAAAAQRMAAVGTLAAGLAHDMSNLLLPLRMRLAALMGRKGLDEEVRGELVIVSNLLDHLRTLSGNLSLFSRDPSQDGVVGRTNVAQWHDSVRKLLDASVGAGIAVEWQCDPRCPDPAIAPHRLTQTVQNLIHNSRNALLARGTSPDGWRARIGVTVAPGADGRSVVVTVSDNGVGMDEETAQRAIEPFFTTRDRPEQPGAGGSGLGLSLAHQIVERAGGSMTIDSVPGEGTTITIALPTAQG